MPGRKWEVEKHPKKQQIIKAITQGDSVRDIGGRFGISKSAICRYLNEKLVKQYERAREKGLETDGENLKKMVVGLLKDAREFLDAAIEDLDDRKPVHARLEAGRHIETCRRLIETLAKLEGQINGGTTINIINNPIWIQVYQEIMKVVEDPKVREKIASALDNIEESS